MQTSEQWYQEMVDAALKWYDEDPETRFDKIVGQKRPPHISLRLIDYFVVNYANTNNVWWIGQNGEPFAPHEDYAARCAALRKVHFDAFSRGRRIPYRHTETTLGQLNFFRWAQEKRVLEYIYANYDLIAENMKMVFAKHKELKESLGASAPGKQPLCAHTLHHAGVACLVKSATSQTPPRTPHPRAGLSIVYELD